MCKYDKEYAFCKTLKPDEIRLHYQLNGYELKCMRLLYKKQVQKQEFLEQYFYGESGGMKYWSKVLGSLKKKGLIYSVIDMPGWIGTDIQV